MSATVSRPNSGGADRRIFPLSKLAQSIEVQLERSFKGTYWITAEISKLNHYPQSGHCYPQLVEKQGGKIVAEFRAFLLHMRYREADAAFREVAGKPISDGMQILFRCKVGYHPIYGLSLNILEIEPSYTLGEMSRMRTEAIRRLRADGIFDLNKSLRMPTLVGRIAVISVETSKGWQDFQNTLSASRYAQAIHIDLFAALLQGDAAIKSIGDALDRVASEYQRYDIVCIIRGGGGETGLDCYDSYHLAQKVCRHPLPVITGIGHASNLTVAEQVAHHNLITPTALAGFIIDRFEKFEARITSAEQILKSTRRNTLKQHSMVLDGYSAHLRQGVRSAVADLDRGLERTIQRFQASAKKAIERQQGAVDHRLPTRLSQAVHNKLRSENLKVATGAALLPAACDRRMARDTHALHTMDVKAKLLDPVNTLKRGFSITFADGKAVKDSSHLKEGAVLQTRFANGSAESTVTKTET